MKNVDAKIKSAQRQRQTRFMKRINHVSRNRTLSLTVQVKRIPQIGTRVSRESAEHCWVTRSEDVYGGFDPPAFGLWARHSSAELTDVYLKHTIKKIAF